MPLISKQGYRKVKLEANTEGITQETLARVKIIARMIAKGKARITCIDYIMKTWGVGEQQANKIYRATLDYLAAEHNEDGAEGIRIKLVNLLEKQIEELAQRNSVDARRAAQSAADLIAKLNSLYTDKKDIKVQGDVSFEFGQPDNVDEV